MAIIVPTARAPGSLTAQPRVDPARFDIGSQVARLGAAAAGAAFTVDDQNVAAELREARVAAAERLGEARATFESDGNWAGLPARFEAESGRIAEEIAQPLSPRARAEFDLAFREMRAPHVVGLREREIRQRRDHERGRLTASLETLVGATANAADERAALALADQTADTIAEARAAGIIGAEEEQSLLQRAGARTANARALRLLREDPAALDARLAAGDFDQLGPEAMERLRASAQGETARRASAAEAQAAAAERQQLAALQGEVQDAVRLLSAGLTPNNLEPLRSRAAGTPLAQPLEVTLRANRAAGGIFAVIPPQAQAEALREMRATPAVAGDEVTMRAVEAVHEATIRSVSEDLLGHVAARGIVEVPPLDLSAPETIAARIVLAEGLAEQWTPGAPVRYLTAAETAGWAARLRDATPEDQLALAAAVVDAGGARAPALLGEIGLADPLFAHAGALIVTTADDRAARTILQGRQLLDSGAGVKPKPALRNAAIAVLAAEATAGDAAMRAQLLAAADAHFAASGAAIDPADDRAIQAAYEASLQAAAGGVVMGGRQFGGLQEVNGRQVILPASLDARLARDVLRAATPAQLAAASLGGAPHRGLDPLDGPLDDVQLIYDGGGAYLLGRDTGAGMALLGDPTQPDGYFRLDLDALGRSVPPRAGWWERLNTGPREVLGGKPPKPPAAP